MNASKAVFAALACALGLSACYPAGMNPPLQSAPSKVGTWQLVPASNGGVWKLNTETGEIRRCLDGMLEKACVLANDVQSVAELKENATPPSVADTQPLVPDVATPATPPPAATPTTTAPAASEPR